LSSAHPGEPAITAEGLVKVFGGSVRALDGLDLEVSPGRILGLLGPNGSGKTTLVRVLTTLITPDAGRATVLGRDVVHEAAAVRRLIGLAGQFSAVDEHLIGLENVEFAGRLYHLPAPVARRRAAELLERLDLAEAAGRRAKGYSGGMKRRLDLAASLIGQPAVLFLDEPTTGLDPPSRLSLWEVIRELVRDGTTLLLTTQYLEEADQLADRIVVIDHGKVIAEGTAGELKDKVGGNVLELRLQAADQLEGAAAALAPLAAAAPQIDRGERTLHVAVGSGGSTVLAEAVRRLDAEGVAVEDLALHRPSLDDVFLVLTGRRTGDDAGRDTGGTGGGTGGEGSWGAGEGTDGDTGAGAGARAGAGASSAGEGGRNGRRGARIGASDHRAVTADGGHGTRP
jgi:ABC-2 type transport system ATP-binding protein